MKLLLALHLTLLLTLNAEVLPRVQIFLAYDVSSRDLAVNEPLNVALMLSAESRSDMEAITTACENYNVCLDVLNNNVVTAHNCFQLCVLYEVDLVLSDQAIVSVNFHSFNVMMETCGQYYIKVYLSTLQGETLSSCESHFNVTDSGVSNDQVQHSESIVEESLNLVEEEKEAHTDAGASYIPPYVSLQDAFYHKLFFRYAPPLSVPRLLIHIPASGTGELRVEAVGLPFDGNKLPEGYKICASGYCDPDHLRVGTFYFHVKQNEEYNAVPPRFYSFPVEAHLVKTETDGLEYTIATAALSHQFSVHELGDVNKVRNCFHGCIK